MKDFIVANLEAVLTIVFLGIVAACGFVGFLLSPVFLELAYGAGLEYSDDNDAAFEFFGAVGGAAIGFCLGSVLLGFAFLLLDIREKLIEQNAILRSRTSEQG